MEYEKEQDQDGENRASEGPPPEKRQPEYEIDIFADWCKGCGICAAFCPRNCIVMSPEGKPVIDKPERCTGCGWCELHCPDFAICVREVAASKASKESGD